MEGEGFTSAGPLPLLKDTQAPDRIAIAYIELVYQHCFSVFKLGHSVRESGYQKAVSF